MTGKKKLIEVALPLEAINRASVREKNIRHGHPSTLHLWWARRPLAACRAVLFAQLVDDPSARPDLFPTDEDQRRERERLFRVLESLVVWENSNDAQVLRQARSEIDASADGQRPILVDPFAGGGSIPLEGMRLGLPVLANDLNPLAVLLNRVLLDIANRFEISTPTTGGVAANASDALAQDLRHWASVLESRVAARVGGSYPNSSTGAEPLVYFWARTVGCPSPGCGVEIPLVGQWRLSGRRGSEATLVPTLAPDGVHVDAEVLVGRHSEPLGTLQRTSGRCPVCGSGFPLEYVKAEGKAGRMGTRLLAVQERLGKTRSFRPASDSDRRVAEVEPPEAAWLVTDLSTHSQYMAPPRYGLTTFRDLFTPRQLASLNAFVEELDGVAGEAGKTASARLGSRDSRGLDQGGRGPRAYGEAIRVLLALGISRLVNRASSLCIWDAGATKVNQVFSRQAYSMTWFFAEANPLAGASGSFSGQIEFLAKAVEAIPSGEGQVVQGPAQDLTLPDGLVASTDPPYYDAVPYADLSDFFIVWLRRMLGDTMPEVFPTILSPKSDELVADRFRHGGKSSASAFFEAGLATVFRAIGEKHRDDYPMTVFYAFKANETGEGPEASTGWETFLHALVDSGWAVVGTWPIRTEQAGGLRELGRNALASSVVVVCRRRTAEAGAITRKSFLTLLATELPAALRALQQGAIAPVDLAQAAIGPGMAVFTRFAKVVEVDGSDMTVRTALALINQVLDEVLADQEGDFDSDTRFCVKWFTQFGWNEGSSGEADVLARATNSSVEGLARGGVFRAVAGKARLLAPEELSPGWDPATDVRVSDWEVAVRIAYTLQSQGVQEAARLMAGAGHRVDLDAVKELAYLLFTLSEKKGRTESAILFNSLVTSWGDLQAAARSAAGSAGVSQGALSFDDEG